jgi:hypothetical protein
MSQSSEAPGMPSSASRSASRRFRLAGLRVAVSLNASQLAGLEADREQVLLGATKRADGRV